MAGSILERFRGDLTDYKPIPFWSWNDELKPDKLRQQIRDMKKAGMGGFFMHARGGLKTEYLSEDWFGCVSACVDEAGRQHMHAWAYDENGWPSGFAGMKLLKDPANRAHYLVCKHAEAFDPAAIGCYRVENGDIVRLTDDDGSPCECVYDLLSDSYCDVLNWKVVRSFIEETHEKYYKRNAREFGSLLMGFFTDEPQYYRFETAYSPAMRTKFKSKYSCDILDELGALFLSCRQTRRFKYRYWLTMNELYTEAFAGQIYRWCQEHNCKLTGHTIDENSLFGQVSLSGGVMPFYEYEHIPGIDCLTRHVTNEVVSRQVSSVAMQLGKKQVLTETFAGCGWGITPRQLKRIAEWQYVNGVNLMCHHLYPYSIRGQRKRDYPAFYSLHNPWAKELKHFNTYFTRLGYMLANSREMADTLIIHPLHSAYLDFDCKDPKPLSALNDGFVALCEKLGAAGVLHHYADETLLKKYVSVRDGKLRVGKCAYSAVIVPEMENIDSSTLSLLQDFVKAGGKLCFAGEKPRFVDGEEATVQLESNTALGEIGNPGFFITDKDTAIRLTVRRSDFGDFIYAVNLSGDKKQSTVFHINARGARRFDVEKPGFEPLYYVKAPQGIDIPLELEAGQSIVVFLSSLAESAPAPTQETWKRIESPEAVIESMDDNTLTLDTACLSFDGSAYTEPMPIMAISDKLLRERQNRTVYLKYAFEAGARPARIRLETEDVAGARISLNGIDLTESVPGSIDDSFRAYDVSKAWRIGTNEIVMRLDYYQNPNVYEVFEKYYIERDASVKSRLNCLSYDTDIEAVYLRGDFCLCDMEFAPGKSDTLVTKGGFSVTLPRKYVNLSTLPEDGYPFFGGSMTVRTVFDADGTEKKLRLKGAYCAARVSVNDSEETLLMFGDTVNVEGLLKRGSNLLRITLIGSMRNTLGDFHASPNPEPNWIGPDDFSHYGKWEGNAAPGYTPEYSFVRFGVDSIELS